MSGPVDPYKTSQFPNPTADRDRLDVANRADYVEKRQVYPLAFVPSVMADARRRLGATVRDFNVSGRTPWGADALRELLQGEFKSDWDMAGTIATLETFH